MPRCQCITSNNKQCLRKTSTQLGTNFAFCYQHQNCGQINTSLNLLIMNFINGIRRVSHANECYDWSCASKIIRDKLIKIYNQLDRKDANLKGPYKLSVQHWHELVNYCAGFKAEELNDMNQDLYNGLSETSIYTTMLKLFEFLLKDMYDMKFIKI